MMDSMTVKGKNATLPVSKWDKRILDNKRRRNAEIRRHIFQLIITIVLIGIVLFGVNSMVSKAGNIKEDKVSVKYYKNICVERGETLMSIAKDYADKAHYDTLDQYIWEVMYMNHLKDADNIPAGYYLIVPYYSDILQK